MVDLDSSEYDLIVIGGGSGGLACSKEGKDKKSTLNTKSWKLFKPWNSHDLIVNSSLYWATAYFLVNELQHIQWVGVFSLPVRWIMYG